MIDKIKQNIYKHRFSYLLVLIVITGYFEIALFQKTLKFDAIYVHYPWRYVIVNSLRSFELPLWNFYQHLGLPIHADPQSGAWYPVVWLFALFGRYTLFSFNAEFILHILIAAFGFYKLLNFNGINKTASITGASVYVFSGFFVGHAAHFTWIISISWIPWIIYLFQKTIQKPEIKTTLLLSVFSMMLLTGGYPAFVIILFYVLLIWSIAALIKSNEKSKLILHLSGAVIMIILLSAPYLFSVIESLDYFVRGNGIDYQYATEYALTAKTLISILAPFFVVSVDVKTITEYFHTDISMTNVYFGILTLIFALISIIKFPKKRFLFLLAVFFLIISFGSGLFIHRFLFNYLPGFNLFRFPALFRYFFISLMIFLFSISFDSLLSEKRNYSLLTKLIKIFIAVYLLIIIYVFSSYSLKWNFSNGIYHFITTLSIFQQLLIQSFIQIVLLFTALVIISKKIKIKVLLPLIIIADVIISFQIYAPYTLYPYKSDIAENQKVINKSYKDLSLSDNENIFLNSNKLNNPYPFDRSFNVYKSEVSYKGNYSFLLKNTELLMDSFPDLFKNITGNPLVFIAIKKDSILKKKRFIYTKSAKNGIVKLKNHTSKSLEFSCFSKNNAVLVLLQNYYPGWIAEIDGKQQDIIISDFAFMSVDFPSGYHTVKFYYKPEKVIMAFWISFVLFIIIVIYLIIKKYKTLVYQVKSNSGYNILIRQKNK